MQVLESDLVEIFGVVGQVEVLEAPSTFQGKCVDPNHKLGQTLYWDEDLGKYVVHTVDGLYLSIPEGNLRPHEHLKPEDGGFDLVWPGNPRAYPAFSSKLAGFLSEKGYSVVQMFQPDAARSAAVASAEDRTDYSLPRPEFAEAFLGRDANCKVAVLPEMLWGESPEDPMTHYIHLLQSLCWIVGPIAGTSFDFEPWQSLAGTVLRVPLTGTQDRQRLEPGPIGQQEVANGEVESHLDFVQRRRLCFLYMIHNQDGGFIELHPHASSAVARAEQGGAEGCEAEEEPAAWPTTRLPIHTDRVLIFCHDRMAYSYKPSTLRDVVLQSWMLDEPQLLKIDGFEGTQKGLEAVVGGLAQPADRQVHVLSAHSRLPANGNDLDAAWRMFSAQTSTMQEIPVTRYDMSLYFEADVDRAIGKSVSKHSGLLDIEEWQSFDNIFFGVKAEEAAMMAPCHRVLMEMSWEVLYRSGFALTQSLKGSPVSMIVADCTSDWDGFFGHSAGSDVWLRATCSGAPSSTRVMYTLGLTGTSKQLDTACSSGLVATNLCHVDLLRQGPGGRITTGIAMSSQSVLQPWGYIGLSGAHMVGPAGRVLWADGQANGMTRGEGAGGLCMRVSRSVQATQDRMACYVASFINQDGRSASLTAPNGPSQQKCVQGALRDVSLVPTDICSMETHGTGTALGDPIEIGSCRAVYLRRTQPLGITTAKSHLAHLEGCAGIANVLKILVTITHATVPPNVHLRSLNSHIEDEGFPALFLVENLDMGADRNTSGTNAFGFGGTNAHGIMWARCRRGPRRIPAKRLRIDKLDYVTVTCTICSGPMCWLCGVAVPKHVSEGRHRCAAVRAEPASYDCCSNCYTGSYSCGEDTIFLDDVEEVN